MSLSLRNDLDLSVVTVPMIPGISTTQLAQRCVRIGGDALDQGSAKDLPVVTN